MVETFEIRQGTGRVTVEKQGLYYRFSCRCRLPGEGIYRLVLETDTGRTDLGVCVPMEGGFGTEKKLPCKKVSGANWSFHLLPGHERMQGRFVPVYPEEPFAYMARLKNAYLANREGQMGIVIAE